jgi:integrase
MLRGERVYHHFGAEREGWTEERVEQERAYVMAQVARGEYMPQRPQAGPPPAAEVPTFQVFASIVLARKKRRVGEKTYKDFKWRLETAMDHFGHRPVDQIDAAVADEFVEQKLLEREAIEQAAAAERPLFEEYADARTGRRHQRRKRGLSNGSINKVLVGVRRVLKEAQRHGLVERNALEDPDCYLRARSAKRSFLELPQILALFDAARALDDEQRRLEWRDVDAIRASTDPATRIASKYGVSDTLIRRIRRGEIWTKERPRESSRLPVVSMLVLAGPRVSELCALDKPQLDLATRAIRMPRIKTDASERVVPMVPGLHEVLLTHRAEQATAAGPAFLTRTGTRQTPDNLRRHLLRILHDRANEALVKRGEQTIAHLTPHTLRRTFASLLAELGVSPRRAMYLLGHTDPTFTMRVYQQVLDMRGSGLEQLEAVLGCTVDEALALLSGREVLPMKSQSAGEDRRRTSRSSGR